MKHNTLIKKTGYNQEPTHITENIQRTVSIFRYNQTLAEINLPDTMTSIKIGMFMHCTGLQTVNLPQKLTKIGSLTFYGCKSLRKIALPLSVTSIGDNAFAECSKLQKLSLPNKITTLCKYAFSNCISLNKVTLSSRLTSIHEQTFNACSSLKAIEFPSTLTTIHPTAFIRCESLTYVKFNQKQMILGDQLLTSAHQATTFAVPTSSSRKITPGYSKHFLETYANFNPLTFGCKSTLMRPKHLSQAENNFSRLVFASIKRYATTYQDIKELPPEIINHILEFSNMLYFEEIKRIPQLGIKSAAQPTEALIKMTDAWKLL